jgi:hypothetical protein
MGRLLLQQKSIVSFCIQGATVHMYRELVICLSVHILGLRLTRSSAEIST